MAGNARLFEDYDLERWSDGTEDASGNLVWHHGYPNNDQWGDIAIVTLNLNPQGEPDYRNYVTLQGTLGPPGSMYDIADVADNALDYYGFEYGG